MKGQWYYLYRAVDKHGQTIDFLLTEHRDTEAALVLKKAIRRNGLPETITIDGSDANEAAIKRYNEEHGTTIAIRQVKYLNNVVEQDHRAVKRITAPMLGFKAFDAAQCTLAGVELMHDQETTDGGRGRRRRPHCGRIVLLPWLPNPLHRQGQLTLHDLLSKICDKTRNRARRVRRFPRRRRCARDDRGKRRGAGRRPHGAQECSPRDATAVFHSEPPWTHARKWLKVSGQAHTYARMSRLGPTGACEQRMTVSP